MSGVKGMRWGVRKQRKYPVGPVKVAPKQTSPVKGTLGATGPGTGHRNYDITKLDNASLKKVVDRMALEKRYNELNHRPNDANLNSVFNKKFMLDLMKQSVSAAAAATTGHIVRNELNKRLPKGEEKKN